MTVSVATYDPGGWSDNFCALYSMVTKEKILLTDAKFWSKKDMPNLTTKKIKDDIYKIHNAFEFHYTLCETNNQGNMIISDLRSYPYKLHVIGITTSAKMTDGLCSPTSRQIDTGTPSQQRWGWRA